MDENINNNTKDLEKKSNWGGAREGSGRPIGSMTQDTKDRLTAGREMKKRIIENSQRILDKQLTLAEGCQYLMFIKTKIDEKGKRTRQKAVLVTDEETIRKYIDGELEDDDTEYYFITTERPDPRVLDSLLDRGFGKATQSTEIKGDMSLNITREIIDEPTPKVP